MEKYRELIEGIRLLEHLSYETIEENLNLGKFRIVSYGKNNIMHFQGEHCKKLEIILEGRVVVENMDKSGNLLKISKFGRDDILGGNLLFSKEPYYPMTVSSLSEIKILEIHKDTLFHLLYSNPEFLLRFLEFVSDHAFILGDKIKTYGAKTIRENVLSFLAYESKKQGSNHIKLRTSKKALGEKMGVQRTSLSRELLKMKNEGLVLYDRDSITILPKGEELLK